MPPPASRFRRVALAALVVCAAVLGLAIRSWTTKREHPAPTPPAAPSGTPASASPSPHPDVSEGRFVVGRSARYSLSMSTAMRAKASAPAFELTLDGSLELTVIAVDRGRATLHFSVDAKPRVRSDSKTQEQALSGLADALRTPFAVVYEPSGVVAEVGLNPRLPSLVRGIDKTLAAAMQLARPESEDASEWTAEESDATGRYRADYKRPKPRFIEKRKVKYLELAGVAASPGLHAKVEVQDSLAGYVLAPDGGVSRLESVETLQTGGTGGLPEALVTTRLTLERTTSGRERSGLAPLLVAVAGWPRGVIHEVSKAPGPAPEVDLARIRGRTFADLTTQLVNAMGKGERDQQVRGDVMEGLSALLRLSDAAVDDAVAFIRGDTDVARFVMDALAAAGTPKAQAALRDLLARPDGFSNATRKSMLIGLSLVPSPTGETIEHLHSLEDDAALGRQATLGLGSATYALRESDPAAARAELATLLDRLQAAPSSAERALVLRAIGNAGLPDALPAIEPYLVNDDPTVRVAAVNAMRRVPGVAVDAKLAELAARQSDAAIRPAALKVIGERGFRSTALPVVLAASRATDYPSRVEAVRILRAWHEEVPQAEAALEWVARNEPVEQLRELAASAL